MLKNDKDDLKHTRKIFLGYMQYSDVYIRTYINDTLEFWYPMWEGVEGESLVQVLYKYRDGHILC